MAVCVWNNVEYSTTGIDAERELARVMVRAGCPDGRIVRGAMRAHAAFFSSAAPEGFRSHLPGLTGSGPQCDGRSLLA
jgi:hypothetical protein